MTPWQQGDNQVKMRQAYFGIPPYQSQKMWRKPILFFLSQDERPHFWKKKMFLSIQFLELEYRFSQGNIDTQFKENEFFQYDLFFLSFSIINFRFL